MYERKDFSSFKEEFSFEIKGLDFQTITKMESVTEKWKIKSTQ